MSNWMKSWILQRQTQQPFHLNFQLSSRALICSQSQRCLSPTDSSSNSTCSVGPKALDKGRVVPALLDTPQKTLADGPNIGQQLSWFPVVSFMA